MRLKDRIAIVVGAGQSPGEGIGNGRATALTFGREGAKVLCVDHNLESAQETADMISEKQGTALAFKADVTKDAQIKAMIAETEGKPSGLEPLAKAILRGAREMVRELAMSDATFAEIKKELSDEHMTDLVLTIAFYCAVVRVLATMQIDNEPTYKEVLKQYPIPGVN